LKTNRKTLKAPPAHILERRHGSVENNVQTTTCERTERGLKIRFILPSFDWSLPLCVRPQTRMRSKTADDLDSRGDRQPFGLSFKVHPIRRRPCHGLTFAEVPDDSASALEAPFE